jgi:hypothetical protein
MSTSITVTDSGVTLTVSPSGGGVVGVGIPSGGSTGEVLTKTSNNNYAVAWQTPSAGALASDWQTMGANVTLSAGNWVDAVTASLAAGTWLVSGHATLTAASNQQTLAVRVYDPAGTAATASMHAEHSNEPHSIALSAIVTLAAPGLVKLQARCLASAGTAYAAYEGLGNTSTTLACVQIA